jgi:hypothetical protein
MSEKTPKYSFPHYVVRQYRRESIAKFRGNPYIEALMDLPSDVDIAKMLTFMPEFAPSERFMSKEYRIQRLDCLYDVVVALPRAVSLARGVLKIVRTGYASRSPSTNSDFSIHQALFEAALNGHFASPPRGANACQHSLGIAGHSGGGKSYTLRRIAELMPRVLFHEKFGEWQLPFLFVEMAPDGESVHTLASGLFEEIDRLLPGENYTHHYMESRSGNAVQRLARAFQIAHQHGVGAIIIDEKQNQRSIGNDPEARRKRKNSVPRNETLLSKHLITASNTSNIPLVMSGTLEMLNLFGARFTRGRRISGRGSGVWLPLVPSYDLANPDEFELLMMALWKYQFTQKTVKLTTPWLKFFHRLTQGIPDIMVKLFEAGQVRAIVTGVEVLTFAIVEAEYRLQFMPSNFGIRALHDKNTSMLEAVPDLWPAQLEIPSGKNEEKAQGNATSGTADATKGDSGSLGKSTKLPQPKAVPKPQSLPASLVDDVELEEAVLAGKLPVGTAE